MGRNRGIHQLTMLHELGENIATAVKNTLAECAEIVVADAKRRCPVKTGKLRDSIKAQAQRNGTVIKIVAEAYREGRDGKKYYYGKDVEFNPKINKPFLYPAMDAHRQEIREKIEDAIRNAINGG